MRRASYLIPSLIALVLANSAGPLFSAPDRSGRWIQTANMSAARTYETATLLANGQVLVTGGYGGSSELASTELFNPATSTFRPAGNMAFGRSNHTATLLPNGKVLVVGGQLNGGPLASAELFDPSTGTWTQTGNLHTPRSYHAATLLSDGQVLVTGGVREASPPVFSIGAPPGSALTTAEIYDPATGMWTVTDSMHTARFAHTSTLLKNGDVLVTGGISSRNSRMKWRGGEWPDDELRQRDQQQNDDANIRGDSVISAEIFDHKTRNWKLTGSLLNARYNHTATLLPSGDVLVAGGQANWNVLSGAEIYHVSSGSWTPTGNLLTSRNGHTADLLSDGRVYVAGGANNSGVLTTTEFYDASTGIWEIGPSLNTTHALDASALLPDGKLLVVGGCYALGMPTYSQISAELFDPKAQPPPPPIAIAPPPTPPAPFVSTPPSTLAFLPRPPSPPNLLMFASSLLVVTLCVVIITACIVVLIAAWLAFVLVERWRK